MAAHLGEGAFGGPATDEPAEDIEPVRVKLGAEKGLRFEFGRRIAHQNIADVYAMAGMVRQGAVSM